MAEAAEPEKLVELEKLPDPEKVPDPEACVPPEAPAPPPGPPPAVDMCLVADVALRVLFFASTLTAVVVMVTGNQTKVVPVRGGMGPVEAKFNNSPALVYFVAALSVACLYSIITALASISVILAPSFAKDFLLFFLVCDVVILGIVASATGTAATVSYIGLKGNSHVNWGKVCNVYDTFCQHIGSATAVSLFATVVLVVLISLSVISLHKKVPK